MTGKGACLFNLGSEYTRDEIHEKLGGSKQSHLKMRPED